MTCTVIQRQLVRYVEVVCWKCGRTGTHDFLISSGNGDGTRDTWCCGNVAACERRQAAAAERERETAGG